jgi:hypothetical protein
MIAILTRHAPKVIERLRSASACCDAQGRYWHEPEEVGGAAISSAMGVATDAPGAIASPLRIRHISSTTLPISCLVVKVAGASSRICRARELPPGHARAAKWTKSKVARRLEQHPRDHTPNPTVTTCTSEVPAPIEITSRARDADGPAEAHRGDPKAAPWMSSPHPPLLTSHENITGCTLAL